MGWICNQCETENPSHIDVCEVCGANAPSIVNLEYNKLYAGKPVKLTWDTYCCTKSILRYGEKEVDVTEEHEYEIDIEEGLANTDIEFRLSNENVSARQLLFHLDFIESPSISFTSNKLKIRKGAIDNVLLNWDIQNAKSVFLVHDESKTSVPLVGSQELSIGETSTYAIEVLALDEVSIFKEMVEIQAFDESEISFSADKMYVYPRIPIRLTWKVKNAKRVWIGDEEVPHQETKVVEQNRATTYVLKVEDEFGTKEERLHIDMLPVPQIRTLLVPTPRINNNLAVTIRQPQYNVSVQIPQIEVMGVKLKMSHAPSLKDSGLMVDLSLPELKRPRLLKEFKSIFHYYFNKIKHIRK